MKRKAFVIFRNMVLLVGIILILGMASSVIKASGQDWIKDGDVVFQDDENVRLEVFPHTITHPQYVYFNLTTKQYSGNIDMALGFDRTRIIPERAEFYNPQNVTFYANYTCFGRFDYTLSPNYAWCYSSYKDNSTGIMINNSIYESAFDAGDIQTKKVWWLDWRMEEWHDFPAPISSQNYNYGGMNKWYFSKNIPVSANTEYMMRVYMNVIPSFGNNEGTLKYWFAVKPSAYTIQQAILNNVFFSLDPWVNSDASHRINVTFRGSANNDTDMIYWKKNVSGISGAEITDCVAHTSPYIYQDSVEPDMEIVSQDDASTKSWCEIIIYQMNLSVSEEKNLTIEMLNSWTNSEETVVAFNETFESYSHEDDLTSVSSWVIVNGDGTFKANTTIPSGCDTDWCGSVVGSMDYTSGGEVLFEYEFANNYSGQQFCSWTWYFHVVGYQTYGRNQIADELLQDYPTSDLKSIGDDEVVIFDFPALAWRNFTSQVNSFSPESVDYYMNDVVYQGRTFRASPTQFDDIDFSAHTNSPKGTIIDNIECGKGYKPNSTFSPTVILGGLETNIIVEDLIIANLEYTPANNSAYSFGTDYKFNVTVIAALEVDKVILEFDGVNRTNTSRKGNEYEFNVGGLAVGSYGNNIYYSNDTGVTALVNDTGMYTVVKAAGSITLTSNATVINMTESVLVNCNTPSGGGADDLAVTLRRNGILQANNTIFRPSVQAAYNFTCFQNAGENYTAAASSQIVNTEGYIFVSIFDEETNLPFATNETNETTIEVFCEGNTFLETVTGSNHTIKVDCNPKFVRIEADFRGDVHFRDQVQAQGFGNMKFYMVNETSQTQPANLLEINFLLNDLTGQFDGATLKLKKAINGTFETINSQNFDAEGKVVAFLIKNDLYRITVDNGIEERTIGSGDLFATSAGDKNVNVDRISFAQNITSIYNELSYNITTVNISSSGFPLIRLTYFDSTNGTNGIIFQILNSSSFDQILYQNISNSSYAIFNWSNSSINVNATYLGKVIIDHSVFGEVNEIFYITFWQPGLDKLPLEISNFWRGIIASLLVIVVALSFGRAYKEVGLLFTTGTIFFLSLIGWLPFNKGTVVLFMFAAVIYVVSSRRRVN